MTPNKRISLGISTDLAYMTADQTSTYVNPFTYAYFANPYERPFNADGSYAADNTYFMLARTNGMTSTLMPSEGFNIFREMDQTSNETKNVTANVNAQLGISILRNLKFEGLAAYGYTSNVSEIRIRLGWTDRSKGLPWRRPEDMGRLPRSLLIIRVILYVGSYIFRRFSVIYTA